LPIFFFQAEDGIRDGHVTGVQTCALPIFPENPRFAGLPEPRAIPSAPAAYVERTAVATPLDRAKAAQRICDPARAKKLSAAGFVATLVEEVAVASSKGTWAYWPRTGSEVQVVAI